MIYIYRYRHASTILPETVGGSGFYGGTGEVMTTPGAEKSADDSLEPTGAGAIAERVRRDDRDRFLCTLFALPEHRDALLALYAFHAEIAAVRDGVSEAMVGQLRLKWWYDAVPGIVAGTPPEHPVAVALADAGRRHPLDADDLRAMIEVRAQDLTPAQPADMATLERYAEATSGRLARTALRMTGAAGAAPDAAVRGVAVAWALIGLVRAIPVHAARGYAYVPKAVCAEAGLDPDALSKVRRGSAPPAGLGAAVGTLRRRAAGHLDAARRVSPSYPRAAAPVFLQAVLCEVYARRLAARGDAPSAPVFARPAPGTLATLRLAWSAYRRTY